jgi:nucleotide-binding universal stress UspA family protein
MEHMDRPTKGTIIWSIDPSQNPHDSSELVKELKKWSQALHCEIQPVGVFSTFFWTDPKKLFQQKGSDRMIAEKAMESFLKKIKLKNLLPPKLLLGPWISRRRMAFELTKFAQRNNSLIIFANSRARKGLNPLRLGGFVEMMASLSRVPLLILNPQAKSSAIKKTLFPTDFRKESKIALDILQPWLKSFKSNLLLFNEVERPLLYASEFNAGAQQALFIESAMKDLEDLRKRKMEQLSDKLSKEGLKNSSLVMRHKADLSAEIVKQAKKNRVDLIAMAGHAEPLAQALLGSTARSVLLTAPCPVLLIHNPRKLKSFEEVSQKSRQIKGKSGESSAEQLQSVLTH